MAELGTELDHARSCHNKELRLYHTGDGGEAEALKSSDKGAVLIRFICSIFSQDIFTECLVRAKHCSRNFGIYWWNKFCLHGTQMPMAEKALQQLGPWIRRGLVEMRSRESREEVIAIVEMSNNVGLQSPLARVKRWKQMRDR